MLNRVVSATLGLCLTAACAPRLSPHQELAWDAYKACQQEGPSTKLDQVPVGGGWYISGRENEVARVNNCMLAYRKKAVLEGRIPGEPASLKTTPASPRGDALVADAPVWSTGDAWRFTTSSAAGRKTTYTLRVDREEAVDGVLYYVVKSATRETFYRKSDLAYSHVMAKGELVSRNTPPELHYAWPLAVGATWQQTYHFDRPAERLSYDATLGGAVEAEETVTVPAGTFRSLKIVYRNTRKSILWEQWYAPEVRMWVRMRELALEEGERTREMLSYTRAGKTAEPGQK